MVLSSVFLLKERGGKIMATDKNQEGFAIKNDSHADQVLEDISKIIADINKKEELAKQRKLQIEQWKASEVSKLQSKIDWLQEALHTYFMRLREQSPKLKTYSLPFGKLKMRVQQPNLKYDDEELIKFLQATGMGGIRTKNEIDKKALKQITEIVGNKVIHSETGEVIEGIIVEKRPEKFSIDVKEG
jgi:phage host-nuclease inhibitor protein Gam